MAKAAGVTMSSWSEYGSRADRLVSVQVNLFVLDPIKRKHYRLCLPESNGYPAAFIQRNKLVWPISVQCRMLLVSVSGYHEHLARRVYIAQRRHLSDEALLVHISAVYAEKRGAYGWPRIWRQLRAQVMRVGKLRVQR